MNNFLNQPWREGFLVNVTKGLTIKNFSIFEYTTTILVYFQQSNCYSWEGGGPLSSRCSLQSMHISTYIWAYTCMGLAKTKVCDVTWLFLDLSHTLLVYACFFLCFCCFICSEFVSCFTYLSDIINLHLIWLDSFYNSYITYLLTRWAIISKI